MIFKCYKRSLLILVLIFRIWRGKIEALVTKFGQVSVRHKVNEMAALPKDEILDGVLAVAIEASRKAGVIILENASGADVTERKANARDLLTIVDPMCEQVWYEVMNSSSFFIHNFATARTDPHLWYVSKIKDYI